MATKADFDMYGKNYIGKIIRILDENSILINAGKSDVKLGDIVNVYSIGEQIQDIDGKDLGKFEYIKDTLSVTQVGDKFSVCRKEKYKSPIVEQLATSPLLLNHSIPLKIDTAEVKPLAGCDVTIHVGDFVKRT